MDTKDTPNDTCMQPQKVHWQMQSSRCDNQSEQKVTREKKSLLHFVCVCVLSLVLFVGIWRVMNPLGTIPITSHIFQLYATTISWVNLLLLCPVHDRSQCMPMFDGLLPQPQLRPWYVRLNEVLKRSKTREKHKTKGKVKRTAKKNGYGDDGE